MTEMDNNDLLAEYARTGSESAFATLVSRHVNLVYSGALRFTNNPHHAEEITQAVFIILARKASSLGRNVVLSGWLYQTVRLTSANLMRGEIRRQRREQEVYMQSTLTETESAAWEQIAPMLDEAMGQLGEKDRNAVVLRFFEKKTAQEVAQTLKMSEAAAHKRIHRAVEKLRKFFIKRSVVSTTAVIAGVVSANSVQAAPAALATSISAVVFAKGAVAAGSTLTLIKGTLKIMAWTKAKMAIAVSVAVILTAGTGIVVTEILTHDDGSAKTLMKFDWQKLKDTGQLSGGEIVQMDGNTVLKLVDTNGLVISMRLLTISNPPITKMDYAVVGEMKYDVKTEGHLAMWSVFPPLKPGEQSVPYYSYTGALEGPMKKIYQSSDWREFSLPLDRTGKTYPSSFSPQMNPAVTAKPPERLEISIFCGPGTVYLRNVKLIQWKASPQLAQK
jgi:RNA polymerase sigma factor (sigma-70 family)